jgi:hypothetical protein
VSMRGIPGGLLAALLAVAAAAGLAQTGVPEPAPTSPTLAAQARPTAAPEPLSRPFKLFESIAVTAKAPEPAATEALRGQLQLMTSLRRGWYTGPAIQGPIFEAWNAADYTPAASRTYYGVPYYMRSYADYYFGPPPGAGHDTSLGEALGGALLQVLLVDASRRY